METELLRATHSVCPVCLRQVPAQRVRVGREVFLRKACPEHGPFQAILWRGHTDIQAWIGGAEGAPMEDPPCPGGCGLCPEHLQGTCCVLLEVTSKCNLHCRFCFADGGGEDQPSFEQLRTWIGQLADPGRTLLQLSGGEPTLRDDLPAIVAAAKAAGCRYVQLNSNGIRLAEDEPFVRALAEAGLSFVFLQFDGTQESVHQQLRGRRLLEVKQRAIAVCAAHNLGVTLVPTLVPGVNLDQVGEILKFAVAMSPAVRGVHFQPVSYFGRMPTLPADASRVTLDQLVDELERQSGGLVQARHLLPSRCDHPLCGFHGDFIVAPEGKLVPLSRSGGGADACCGPASPEQNRRFVARRWQRPPRTPDAPGSGDLRDLGVFMHRVQSHGFTVTAMAFQDAGNLDLERLRRCSLHVFHRGRLVPFCAHYLSRHA